MKRTFLRGKSYARVLDATRRATYLERHRYVEHWPLHKKVCCPVEKDHPALRDSNHELALAAPVSLDTIDGCVEVIELLLQNPTERISKRNARLLTFALRQLKELLSEDPRYFVPSHGDIDCESLLGSCFMGSFTDLSSSDLDHLFAIPGFANYFLSDELFLTKAMAIRKENGLGPLPFASSFNDYEDVEEAERKNPGTYAAPLYCSSISSLVINWMRTIVRNGVDKPELISALLRRVFETWVCPYGRIYFSDIRNPATAHWDGWLSRSGIILEFLYVSLLPEVRISCSRGRNEVLPGITSVQLLTRILDDNAAFNDVRATSIYTTFTHIECAPSEWILSRLLLQENGIEEDGDALIHLSIDERILLLDPIVTEDGVGFLSSAKAEGSKASSEEMLTSLVLGFNSSKVLIQMYHRLNEHLSKNDKFVDDETKVYIQCFWNRLQETCLPALTAYVDVVETQRRRKQDGCSALNKPLEFPKEISELICEFSFQDKCSFARPASTMNSLTWYEQNPKGLNYIISIIYTNTNTKLAIIPSPRKS